MEHDKLIYQTLTYNLTILQYSDILYCPGNNITFIYNDPVFLTLYITLYGDECLK